ncbi:DUF2314 domain-containing protein [Steroidobacter sp. S1-65]|uniref:DUF2314 domain-containing protein n=1 Tax=Steroidobacter gossypii TaxID=2805490 RepID=A0ABS1WRG6_9GAMM|nr:DUF2314 domain-containing protein [Steroidobacter gossypii]MBM0103562.1 DUF2314 domain-containing protein [Steroidobacter gossypii]
MSTIIFVFVTAILIWGAWWWFIARNRPALPPLAIDDNDPLMIEAREKAKDSLPQMLELFKDAKGHTNVKVPFVTSSGETEHLWAELLSVEGPYVRVRYMTPPVTHTGELERLQTHALGDIEDWVVTKDPKRYLGGYSMRVMFRRGRELWGDLPPELKEEEAKYA